MYELFVFIIVVLSDMYDGDLLTSEDVQEMKKMEGDLMTRLVFIQCMKEIDNIKRAAEIMSRHGYNQESEMLTGRLLSIFCVCVQWLCVHVCVYGTMQ